MPVSASAAKALRRDLRRNQSNHQVRSKLKAAVDAVRKNPSPDTLKKAYQVTDRAAKKHILHRNKAARLKSQFASWLATPAKPASAAKKSAKSK